jgi:RNA polymerase sigma-70 factor (ECF subfamily)
MSGRNPRPLTHADIAKLLEVEYQGLRRLIVRQTRDQHVAADILNEAVCITWEKWLVGKLARPGEMAGYIFQVAGNLLRNRRRTIGERSDRRANSEVLETLTAPDQPHDEMFEVRLAVKVRELISTMSSHRDRLLLVRFYLEEEDKESICRDLEMEPRQFDKVLHRARKRLRTLLESEGLQQCL